MPKDAPMLILYDGHCPICCKKTDFLKKRDHNERLSFANIRAQGFNPQETGVSFEQLEKQIHALLPDGTVISRMEVIRAAYGEIGLGWLIAPTGWPLLRPLFDRLYGFVARNRLKISRFFQ
jgi:predicted DCC family thiol-disulfide oxidoreductase YuxK